MVEVFVREISMNWYQSMYSQFNTGTNKTNYTLEDGHMYMYENVEDGPMDGWMILYKNT